MKHEITFAPGEEHTLPATLRPAMVNEATSAPAEIRKDAPSRPHILARRAARWARRSAY